MENQDTLIKQLFDSVNGGQWTIMGALVVVVFVGALKKYGSKVAPKIAEGKWAWITAVMSGAGLGIAHAILAGVPLGGAKGIATLAAKGAIVGLTAAGLVKGGNEWFKKPAAVEVTEVTEVKP